MNDLHAGAFADVRIAAAGQGQRQVLRAHEHGHRNRPFGGAGEQRHALAEDHGLVAIGCAGQAVG